MVQESSQKAEISNSSGAPVVSGAAVTTLECGTVVQILKYADASNFMNANGLGRDRKPDTHSCNFWDQGQVYYLPDGRVVEYSQTNCAHSFPLVAVFNSYEERARHRRRLPLHFRRFG